MERAAGGTEVAFVGLKLPNLAWIRVVRADAGFFDQELLEYLEANGCPISSWRG